MHKLDLSSVPKRIKPNPIFKGLPSVLKDVKNFEKTEKKLISVLQSDHKHSTAKAYVKCKECNDKRLERQKIMKDIGFKSLSQYLEWKKIMTIIRDKKNFELR
jgi:hypothetical protein